MFRVQVLTLWEVFNNCKCCWVMEQNLKTKDMLLRDLTHSFLQGWNTPFLRDPPLSDADLKSYPPLSDSHPNLCMQIVRNILKWRCYVSYYTKSIENIINITLFTFRLNSVLTTDTLYIYVYAFIVFIFDMQKEWTWNISNNWIIKSDVYIKPKYIRISLDIYHCLIMQRIKEKEKNNIENTRNA